LLALRDDLGTFSGDGDAMRWRIVLGLSGVFAMSTVSEGSVMFIEVCIASASVSVRVALGGEDAFLTVFLEVRFGVSLGGCGLGPSMFIRGRKGLA